MTKLETLYASIQGLQNLGLPLNKETLKAADELEEQLIKTEILPAMNKDLGLKFCGINIITQNIIRI